jgi:hypothetical protein
MSYFSSKSEYGVSFGSFVRISSVFIRTGRSLLKLGIRSLSIKVCIKVFYFSPFTHRTWKRN